MKEIDYKAFFILGMCFLPLGTIFMTTISPAYISFTGIGVAFMAIGLAHRDEWEKGKKSSKKVKSR